MSPVAAPSDRRFRRAHVKPSRRRRRWETQIKPALTWLIGAAVAAYVAYRVGELVLHASALRVRHIAVRGTHRLSTGEVVAMLGGLKNDSIVSADLKAWRRRLMTSPWVRDATLRRSLPSTVEVVISERQPIGVARINGSMYLVDERGVVMDEYGPEHAALDLPIVDGLGIRSGDSGAIADEPRAQLAAQVIAAVRAKPAVAKRLSQVDVSDVHDAVVLLTGDRSALHLGEGRFLERLESYLELQQALEEHVAADIDSVDLRFGDRIYVRPVSARRGARRAPVRDEAAGATAGTTGRDRRPGAGDGAARRRGGKP